MQIELSKLNQVLLKSEKVEKPRLNKKHVLADLLNLISPLCLKGFWPLKGLIQIFKINPICLSSTSYRL